MQVVLGQQLFGGGAGFIEKALGLPRLVGFGAQQGKVCEGWQAGCTTLAQGLLGKGEVALFGQLHLQWMVGQVSLDSDPAGVRDL